MSQNKSVKSVSQRPKVTSIKLPSTVTTEVDHTKNEWIKLNGFSWASRSYAPSTIEHFSGKLSVKAEPKKRTSKMAKRSKMPSRLSHFFFQTRYASIEGGILFIYNNETDMKNPTEALDRIDLGKCKLQANRNKEIVHISTPDDNCYDYQLQATEVFRTAIWETKLQNGMAYRQYLMEKKPEESDRPEESAKEETSKKPISGTSNTTQEPVDVPLAIRESIDLMERRLEEAKRYLAETTRPRVVDTYRNGKERLMVVKRSVEMSHLIRQATESLSDGAGLMRHVMVDLLKLEDDGCRTTEFEDEASSPEQPDPDEAAASTTTLQHYMHTDLSAQPSNNPAPPKENDDNSYSLTAADEDGEQQTADSDETQQEEIRTVRTPPEASTNDDDEWLKAVDQQESIKKERVTRKKLKEKEKRQKKRRGGKWKGALHSQSHSDPPSVDDTVDTTNVD